jgi:hypothetical protein
MQRSTPAMGSGTSTGCVSDSSTGRTHLNTGSLDEPPPVLDRRIPGASLHPRLRAVGVAQVPMARDARFSDACPTIEVLHRIVAALLEMDGRR